MCANWWKTNLADNKSVNPLPDLTLRTQKSTIIDFYNRHISHLSHLPPLVTSCGQALLARGVISCDDVSAIASLLLRLLFKAKFKSIINNLCRGARRVGEHISRRQFVCHKPKLGQTMRRHCHRRRHRHRLLLRGGRTVIVDSSKSPFRLLWLLTLLLCRGEKVKSTTTNN